MTSEPKTKAGLSGREMVALMAALMALNALAIDILLPALPDIGGALGVSDPNHRQYVIIAYALSLGFAQPFFGPISDRYGRKTPLLVSLFGYAIFGGACIFVQSFEQLLVARALQGVFAAGARVISVSVIRDVHAGKGMARIMSLVFMVFMAVPIVAPNLGQLILWTLSFRWIFATCCLLALALAGWVALRFQETLPEERRSRLDVRSLAKSYGEVFTTRVTLGYMIAIGVVFGALFAFISSAEQVYVDVFGKKDTFTFYFAAAAAGMGVASFLNSRLVERVGMRRLSHGALAVFTAVNLGYVSLLLLGQSTFWLFYTATGVSFFCFSFVGANFNSIAMEPLGHIAGTASAALGFSSTVIAGVLGAIIGQQFNGTVLPLALGFFGLGATSLLIVAWTERGRLFGDESKEPEAIAQAAVVAPSEAT